MDFLAKLRLILVLSIEHDLDWEVRDMVLDIVTEETRSVINSDDRSVNSCLKKLEDLRLTDAISTAMKVDYEAGFRNKLVKLVKELKQRLEVEEEQISQEDESKNGIMAVDICEGGGGDPDEIIEDIVEQTDSDLVKEAFASNNLSSTDENNLWSFEEVNSPRTVDSEAFLAQLRSFPIPNGTTDIHEEFVDLQEGLASVVSDIIQSAKEENAITEIDCV